MQACITRHVNGLRTPSNGVFVMNIRAENATIVLGCFKG
jgi:hypothetical protein